MRRLPLFALLALAGCAATAPAPIGPDTQPAADRKLKVLAVFVTPIEEPWVTVIDLGLAKLHADGLISYDKRDRIAEADLEGTLQKLIADEKPDIVIGDGSQKAAALRRIADSNPGIGFVFGAGPAVGPNLSTFDSHLYEPAYLCGMMAGKLTKTDLIGVVAAFDKTAPSVNANVNAFAAGAKAVNPKAKVRFKFVGAWYDLKKAGDLAEELIAGGVDVIYAERDGVIPVCAAKKVFVFGNLLDQTARAGEVVSGPVWNLEPMMREVVSEVRAGNIKGRDRRETFTLAKGGAALAGGDGWKAKLPKAVVRQIEQTQADIIAGKFDVKVDYKPPRSDP